MGYVDTLISKVVGLPFDEPRQKRMGQVMLKTGRTSEIDYNVLRRRFPYKLI